MSADQSPQKSSPPPSKRSDGFGAQVRPYLVKSHGEIQRMLFDDGPPSTDIDIAQHYEISQYAVEGYVTLDAKHFDDIQIKIKEIREFAHDRTRRRPMNVLLYAEPGSGKSHFAKCLAKAMSGDRISPVVCNMASAQVAAELANAIDSVRDLKVADRLPLLFLDEFDSRDENFALLLPLLWDGEIAVGHRLLQTGRIVILLAGSRIESMRSTTSTTPSPPKLRDLLSRVNGGELNIPKLEERKVDKVCLAIALLRARFSRLETVPWALLRFVADTKFSHGARSIANLVDSIRPETDQVETLEIKDLRLPLDSEVSLSASNLRYHIEEDLSGAVQAWNKLSKTSALVKCSQPDSFLRRALQFLIEEMRKNSS
jgi:hypothetical protein